MSSNYIDTAIYFYIFICLALLVYNIVYILFSKHKDKRHTRRSDKWFNELEAEVKRLEKGEPVSPKHQKRMIRKLKKIRQLMGYRDALKQGRECYPKEQMQQYLSEVQGTFQTLALEYGKHPATERAYYAHLMEEYCRICEKQSTQLPHILLGFLMESTIFCRENVLQALYAIGQPSAVENALTIFQNEGWYHNPRLISDGLATFNGDRGELAKRLWKRCREWNENLQVAVVQFATAVSDDLAPEFLSALENRALQLEGQFALIRYFQRRVYPAAKPILLNILAEEAASTLAIAAASALARYPGEDTRQALMQAIHSRNYYVRKNCALSLSALGASAIDVQTLRDTGDRYAAEMLEYVLREREVKQVSQTPRESTKEGVSA